MNKTLLLCLLFGLTAGAANAAPLGTAFTYSGRLKYQNQPANGNFDLLVTNFDAAIGGNPVGSPNANNLNGLSCVNGLFVTNLDFGAVFNGNAYWLEFWARPTPSGMQNPPYQKLSPRQPVNPSPYALYAPKADTANTASTAAANSVSTASIQNDAVTAGKIASGQVVKSLNGLRDNVNLLPGANITLTPNVNNNTLAIAAGSGGGWSVTGNAGTTAGANFLGTSDNQPLEIKVNNERALRLELPASGFNSSVNLIGGFSINRAFNGAVGATIAGGGTFNGFFGYSANEVGADLGTIGGGAGNSVGGVFGAIPGGWLNQANGVGSFAAGIAAHATHDGTFVWSDGSKQGDSTYGNSTGANRFEVFTRGGAILHTGFLTVSGSGGEQAYFGGDASGGDVQIGSLNPGIGTIACYNGATGTYMDLYVRTLTITGGGDLAEPFPMSGADIAEGSVVIIDDEHPGQLKLSAQPYDTRVAGVVSGAGGINPGLSLRQEGKLEGGQNVALTGRVYVLADGDKGAIKPGDLLTTSPTPGHAMKVTDHARAQGAVLGKAMSTLNSGRGMVLVLVSLQ